jgi:glycerol-3-phosphate acyltransferase PlsY
MESFAVLFCVAGVVVMSPHLFVVGGVCALLPSMIERWARFRQGRNLGTFLGFFVFVTYIALLLWFMLWL